MADTPLRPGSMGRIGLWVRGHVPTRESMERSRLLRPIAHRVLQPSLWRFTRRSVPRGVALGVVMGVLFPFAHMPLAAALALPVRANVPTAVGSTLVNNPLTIGPLLWTAYRIGRWVLRLDSSVPGHPVAANVQAHAGWLHWLVAQGGPATVVGLIILAAAMATLGYGIAALAWRIRVARKWRNRGHFRSV
ncbi:DUF2062 domain-containing protein [Sphingomonas gellani]